MKTLDRQRIEINSLFMYSPLKASAPNLVLSTYEHDRRNFYTVGTYEYNPASGRSAVNPLPDFKELDYTTIKNLLS